jgi:hypothetical protein
MSISLQKQQELFDECYEYIRTLETTKSKEEFLRIQMLLMQRASALQSSKSDLTPDMGPASRDPNETMRRIAYLRGRREEARALRSTALTVRFTGDEEN